MENYTTTNYLESILFYTGTTASQAAQETEQRNYGAYIEGLGYLDKTSNGDTYWTNYSNVIFEDVRPNIDKLSDIFVSANTYAMANYPDYPIGETTVASNRFNMIYSYETDLNNSFSNALPSASTDLKTFFLSLNQQTFNQKKYYGDEPEINSIRIGAVTFYWRPENYVAYTYSYVTADAQWTYYYTGIEITEESYYTDIAGEIPENTYYTTETVDGNTQYYKVIIDEQTSYISSYAYTTHTTSYELAGNDYYAYIRSEYVTMDGTERNFISEAVVKDLNKFEEKYDHNHALYSYYMYDCDGDIEITLDSNHLGVKKSVIPVRFDSQFNHWFTYNIAIPVKIDYADVPVATITSATDNAIFSVRKNENEAVCGDNVTLNEGESHTFTTTATFDKHQETQGEGENETTVEVKDTLSILTPWDIETLDLTALQDSFDGELNLNASNWVNAKGIKMKSLLIGTGATERIEGLTKITGLNELTTLETIDLTRCGNLTSTPAINNLVNLHTFKAKNAAITTFRPADNAVLNNVELNSEAIKLLKLVGVTINGTFDYTPTTALKSLTLDNVTGLDTYQFVNDWYNVLDAADAVDSVIYLSLKGIDWNNVPVSFMENLRKFDINEISGSINIIGSGANGMLTRDEYNEILHLYGLNAFNVGAATNKFKIYPELDLYCVANGDYKCEDYEFSPTVENITVYTDQMYSTMPTTLDVTIEDNIAGNAFLDMLPEDKFTFVWDEVEKYAYCQLDKTIDTSDSVPYSRINAGDIMLYNGDTILIFGENISNSLYEYVKIGKLVTTDENEKFGRNYSTILYWFNNGTTDLHFIEATPPTPAPEPEPEPEPEP